MKNGSFYDVLLRPVLNEKSLLMREKSQFFFEVSASSNKNLIMQSVFAVFGVRPLSCNVKVVKKNRKKGTLTGGRSVVRRVGFVKKKIAMVTFPAGAEIAEISS